MSLHLTVSRAFRRQLFICSDCRRRLLKRHDARAISYNHIQKIKTAQEEWTQRKQDVEQGKASSVLQVLESRGLLNQVVGNRDELEALLLERRTGVYCGVDPTAKSMHIGHLLPFITLLWMYIYGYSVTFLMGGFTARIGDPTDRLTARQTVGQDTRKMNALNMFEQLKKLGVNMEKYAEAKGHRREWAWRRSVVNNSAWWAKTTVNDFMRIAGQYVRIGPMLGRDTVKNRLEKGDGMSYAEFSYPLIQGWDWWQLYQTGTQLQVGGADQFGNILAGAEMVKNIMKHDTPFMQKLAEDTKGSTVSSYPMGFTVPLLTTSSGEKFGKSAGNAVWLDRQLTTGFDLYQFFLKSADDDVERYLKLLTLIPLPEIEQIMENHREDESKRVAQHVLAYNFLEMVHGQTAANEAREKHTQLYSNTLTISEITKQVNESKITPDGRPIDINPSLNKYAQPLDQESSFNINIKLPQSLVIQQPLGRILYSAGLVASRSEGQRMINNKGVYIGGKYGKNGEKVEMDDQITYIPATDAKWSFVEPLLIDDRILILRTGKWKKKFIEIIPDEEFEAAGLTCPGWKEDVETSTDPITTADIAGERQYRHEQLEAKTRSDGPRSFKTMNSRAVERKNGSPRGRNTEW